MGKRVSTTCRARFGLSQKLCIRMYGQTVGKHDGLLQGVEHALCIIAMQHYFNLLSLPLPVLSESRRTGGWPACARLGTGWEHPWRGSRSPKQQCHSCLAGRLQIKTRSSASWLSSPTDKPTGIAGVAFAALQSITPWPWAVGQRGACGAGLQTLQCSRLRRHCTAVPSEGRTPGREEQHGQCELAAPVPQLPAQPGLPKQGCVVDDLKIRMAALQRPARLARAPRKVYYVMCHECNNKNFPVRQAVGAESRCDDWLLRCVTLRVYGEGAKLMNFAAIAAAPPLTQPPVQAGPATAKDLS